MTTSTRGKNLTQSVANSLGAANVTGFYFADYPIRNEADLYVQNRTRRAVVREAVKTLTIKDRLPSRPRFGTWLQPADDRNLLDPDVLGWLLQRKYSPALLIESTELRPTTKRAMRTLIEEAIKLINKREAVQARRRAGERR